MVAARFLVHVEERYRGCRIDVKVYRQYVEQSDSASKTEQADRFLGKSGSSRRAQRGVPLRMVHVCVDLSILRAEHGIASSHSRLVLPRGLVGERSPARVLYSRVHL